MKQSVTKNYIYNLIYQILMIFLPIVTTPYLSRVLGPEGIGVYSYTISIVTYFILFGSLGIVMYSQREIAYVQNDKYKRSKIFFELLVLKFITLSISMAFFYLMFIHDNIYSEYYKILILEIIASMIDVTPFFQGMEEFKKVIKRNILIKLISIISIFIFVKNSNDLTKYLLIYVLSTFIGNISLWFYLPKFITKIPIRKIEIKKHIKPMLVLFIPQMAIQIYTVLDKTMIGAIIGNKSEVGYYEQSQKIVKLVLTIITALGTVMLPRIANQFANQNKDKIKKSIIKSFNFVFILSIPMCLGLILISKNLIPWFLGSGFEKSIEILCVLSPLIFVIGLSSVIGTQYLLPTKKQKKYTISVLIGALTNLSLNIILIPKYSAFGAAIGTIIAETVVTIMQFYFVRKEFEVKSILKMSKNYFLSGVIMVVGVLLLNVFIPPFKQVILNIGIDIVSGSFIYFMTLLLLKDKFMKEMVNKVLKLF